MSEKHPGVSMLLALVIAFSMIMPATIFVGAGSKSGLAVESISPGSEAEHKAQVQIGQNIYVVWIEGEIHHTRIMFSYSPDNGNTWEIPERITTDDFVPMDVQLSAGSEKLHLVWMDAVTRHLRTAYMSFDLAENDWSTPRVFGGENPSMAAQGDVVAIAARHRSDMFLYLSEDEGQFFDTLNPMNEIGCLYPSLLFDNGILHMACIGQDENTGVKGIYYTYSANLNSWEDTSLAAEAVAWMKEISMRRGDNGIIIQWREVSTETIDYYFVEKTFAGSFSEKVMISSEPVVRERYEPVKETAGRLPPKKWTFIVYLDADNNLDGAGYADMTEMETVGSNADLNIIVLFDGDTFSGPDSHCFYIEPGSRTEIPLTEINSTWTGGELNMGDPITAIEFMRYVYNEYPADKYLCDMWNHGGSWDWGMCSDDTSGDHLTSLEVRTIYESLRAATGKIKLFDVAGYDECLMGDASLYYDEMPFIDYMCNSEDSIGFDGWEYDLVLGHLNSNLDMDGEEAAFWVFYSYVEAYGTSGSVTTMSVINATMLATSLAPAINNLAQKGIHEISTYRGDLQSAANNAKFWVAGYTHQRDLYHFCELAIASIPFGPVNEALQGVLDAATANPVGMMYGDPAWQSDRAIMIHNQNSNEHGMKIYINDPAYNNVYDTMTITDTNWDEFYKVLWGADPDNPNNEPTVAISYPSDGGYVTVDTIITIIGTASDTDGTVERVDVAMDTEHWDAAIGTNSWNYDWDTTGWEPGWHTIMARSYDGQDFSAPVIYDVMVSDNLPPTVTLLDNNGQAEDGTWSGTEPITWIATDPNDDDITLDVKVEYSSNGGGIWNTIEDGVDNNDGVCPWDTTAAPDGTNNLLRVTVVDALLNVSTDESDAVFTLDNLPSIDLTSPDGGEAWMGGFSDTIWWNMSDFTDPIENLVVNLHYSTNSGGSYPNVIATGLTGFAGNPCFYDWNPLPSIDLDTVRVRAEVVDTDAVSVIDESSADFEIDSTPPEPATNVHAELDSGTNHVTLYWDLSPSPDVDRYEIWYRTNTFDSTGDTYVFRATVGAGVSSYQHLNSGKDSGATFYWQIRALDAAGHEGRTVQQAAKTGSVQNIGIGHWFLLGSGLVQSDTSLNHVIQGLNLPDQWECVRTYDGTSDSWKTKIKANPVNDLTDITDAEGFWMYIRDTTTRWATAGYIEDKVIDLYEGWNLVAYPFAARIMTSGDMMTHLTLNCPNYDGMMISDPGAPYQLTTPLGTETIQNSHAFWVHVTADCSWNVLNY